MIKDTELNVNMTKQSLKDKWGSFINIILDPWVMVMFVATVSFIYYSTKAEDKNLVALVTVFISLASGLLGGIIANRWAQMTELTVLVARGKSAIRSLKLILLNISNIEKRTKDYINCIESDNKEYKLIISNFEEVIEKCRILQEEIISSIENWTDIIPEVANLKTQIGLISEMKLKHDDLESDILSLNNQITTVKEEGTKQKDQLQQKIVDKESALTKTQEQLKEAERKINSTVLSGLASAPISIGKGRRLPDGVYKRVLCKKCNTVFICPANSSNEICATCRENLLAS